MRSTALLIKHHVLKHKVAYGYVLLSLIILGPLLLPGYLLTLDMVWMPELRLPEYATNTALLYAMLNVTNAVLPSDLIQKIVLLLILWSAGYGMHRLVALVYRSVFKRNIHTAAGFAAGVLATVNPFTYERFMDGHWQILIGYAVLPWITWRLLILLRRPSILNAFLWFVTLIILTMAGSTHMIFMGVLACVAAVICVTRHPIAKRPVALVAGIVAIVALLNLLWIVPALQSGHAFIEKIDTFDYRHNATFRTVGNGWLPPELNILTLHGYWGERQERFVVAQHANPLWSILFIAIAATAVIGGVRLYKAKRTIFWVVASLFAVAWLLALGSYTTVGGGLHQWLIDAIPLFAGYREPQKFAALLALVYAFLFGLGAHHLLNTFRSTDTTTNRLITTLFIALPILYMPFMLWGTMGQLRVIDYPAGWYELRQRFAQEPDDYTVVFLPWHHYVDFDPAGRTIANPARRFFTSTTVIQNEDPGLGLIRIGQTSPEAGAVQHYLIDRKDSAHASQQLARYAVKYIVIAKIADWREYDYLRDFPGLTIVEDNQDVVLLRNTAYRP